MTKGELVSNSKGSLQVPLLLALSVMTLASFGVWGLLRHWRHLTEHQIRLDRCVGTAALALKRTLNRVESANLQISALRAAVAAAATVGQAAEVRAVLEAVVQYQNLELVGWQTRRMSWLVRRGCNGSGDWPQPLPPLSWVRGPEDFLGPQALQWEPGASRALRVELTHHPRAAAAIVSGETHGLTANWKAAWTAPRGIGTLRPSFD